MQIKKFIVLYRIESIMTQLDSPFGMKLSALNSGDAEEQCINAYPDADVVWVFEGDNYLEAIEDFYSGV